MSPASYLCFIEHLITGHLNFEHFSSFHFFFRNFKALYISIYNSIGRFSINTMIFHVILLLYEETLSVVIKVYKGCMERPTSTCWDTVLVLVML